MSLSLFCCRRAGHLTRPAPNHHTRLWKLAGGAAFARPSSVALANSMMVPGLVRVFFGPDSSHFRGVWMREILSYSFVFPPTIFITLCLAGSLISLYRPFIGTKVVLVSSAALYLFSTPVVASFLVQRLTALIPTNVDFTNAQAIVIPGADTRMVDNYSDSVGPITLERLTSAAQLYKRLHLPIAVSGGPLKNSAVSLGSLMRDELDHAFNVPVLFTESGSRNTFENALLTAQLLTPEKIKTVIVVAQARDMSRVLLSFNLTAIHALPYCTDTCQRSRNNSFDVNDFIPSTLALSESYYAFHEIFGLIYYMTVY
jgi:uncharacterized SAM-binding protein YcdF (DUF218 family)